MEDTIAAISTPAIGSGGIGIIRISGSDAVKITDKIFIARSGRKLENEASHTIHYGRIIENGKMIDEVLVSIMKGPKTYTTEDITEINCHGGTFVTKKVLEAVLRSGARLAEPGEFTKRAFLNGRIDLTKAEAVIDVINAKSEYSLSASVDQLKGRLSDEINMMRDNILDHAAFMEAAMDDPENIPMEGHMKSLLNDVDICIDSIEKLTRTFSRGQLIKDGITTVILGRTNAGKSSLLNLLSGSDTAIVTDIEGTTRDAVKERIDFGGLVLNLTDTAGIRKTADKVEAIGVDKALQHASKADLVLFVADGSKPLAEDDAEIIKYIKKKKYIVLINKADLAEQDEKDTSKRMLNEEDLKKIGADNAFAVINFSTKTGKGTDELEKAIKNMFSIGEITVSDDPVISNSRHKMLLEEAKVSLELVKEGIKCDLSEDLLAIDLMDAYTSLGKIIGKDIEDDLADRIFEKFCMGK